MKLCITGDKFFLDRHNGFANSLQSILKSVEVIPSGNLMEDTTIRVYRKLTHNTPLYKILQTYLASLNRSEKGFKMKTKLTESKIKSLKYKPDYIIHFMGTYAPYWNDLGIPYAMYLDFTMAQTNQQWKPWATFKNENQYIKWIGCEKKFYQKSRLIFTFSESVKKSLIEDYNITESKIHVLGSASNFIHSLSKQKKFGRNKILFYGSEFERKGGDIVLNAFREIRKSIPNVTLTIVGDTPPISEPGVENLGYIKSSGVLEKLFLDSDIVIAPSRCDPFPTFVIEGMGYGVPCLITKVSGVSEVITNQYNGIVVDSFEPKTIAKEAINLLNNPNLLNSISANARSLVCEKLNWDIIAKKAVRLLYEDASIKNFH